MLTTRPACRISCDVCCRHDNGSGPVQLALRGHQNSAQHVRSGDVPVHRSLRPALGVCAQRGHQHRSVSSATARLTTMNSKNSYLCSRVHCVCPGPCPFNLFFPVLFLFDWVGVLWPQLSKVLKLVSAGPAASSFLQCPCSSRSSVSNSSSCCLCVRFRGEPTLFPGWCNEKLCYSNR